MGQEVPADMDMVAVVLTVEPTEQCMVPVVPVAMVVTVDGMVAAALVLRLAETTMQLVVVLAIMVVVVVVATEVVAAVVHLTLVV